MARIKEIKVGYKRVIKLADFHSLQPEFYITWENIEEDDDIDALMRQSWETVRNNVAYAAAPILESYKLISSTVARERHENLYLGLSDTAKDIADNIENHLIEEPTL